MPPSPEAIAPPPGQLLINLSFVIAKATGLTTYAQHLYPHLRSLQPTLLAPAPIAGFPCQLVPASLTAAQGFRGHLNRLLWTQLHLPRLYRQLAGRLLFSPVPEAPLYSRCRSVVTVHDVIPLRFPNRRSPLHFYFRYYIPQVLHQAQHIICNSEATASDVMTFFGVPAQRITPIPLACDTRRFRPLSLPSRNYFLYLGRSDPYKNLGRVIAAMARLPKSLDVELWISGPVDSRYTPALMHQARELGIGDRVRWLDYVAEDDLPTIINQAIALVFPSLWEGFGFPALEAMACGTPVIASNLSSIPEVTGDAAVLVDPYRVEAIAQAMQTLVQDTSLRSHLHRAGLARASQFSWEKTGQATRDVLHQHM